MKKFFMMAALAVASMTASAQIYVGGSLGYNSVKATENAEKTSTFSIKPEVGYNLDENWAVGIQLGYTSADNGTKTKSEFEIAPYARYTFAKSGIASFFVDGGIQYVSLGSDAKGSTFGVGFRPGVKIAASEKVDLVAKLGYLGYKSANDDAQHAGYAKEQIGFNIDNTSLEFGVFFNF